jgi:ABC-type lipoprotein release transport system permease subunit
MMAAAVLAVRDLISHLWRVLAHALVFSIAIMAYTALGSYQRSLQEDYSQWPEDQLIVHEDNSFAEFFGSQISPEVLAVLEARGLPWIIPEIHAIVGTSMDDAVLLRGVDLNQYHELDTFSIRHGRALEQGDSPRLTMLGVRLAERLEASIGDLVRLRGREFEVIGTFETGTYTENEAWVPLAGAQDLLGWDDDVSLYVILDDGSVVPGERLLPNLSVIPRGETWSEAPKQWGPLLKLIRTVTHAIGIAAALSLAVMLWRLGWHRRWQFAVLRTIGYSRKTYIEYLGIQALIVTTIGGVLGIAGASLAIRWVKISYGGLSLSTQLSTGQLAVTALWLSMLTAMSVFLPAWFLSQRRVGELINTRS